MRINDYSVEHKHLYGDAFIHGGRYDGLCLKAGTELIKIGEDERSITYRTDMRIVDTTDSLRPVMVRDLEKPEGARGVAKKITKDELDNPQYIVLVFKKTKPAPSAVSEIKIGEKFFLRQSIFYTTASGTRRVFEMNTELRVVSVATDHVVVRTLVASGSETGCVCDIKIGPPSASDARVAALDVLSRVPVHTN